MKTLLEKVEPLDSLIRQLYKIDSKMKSGQFIAAWRDNRRIISNLEGHKENLINNENVPDESEESEETDNS